MKIGDLVKLEKNADFIGIITHKKYQTEEYGDKTLCRVVLSATSEAVWVYEFDLVGVQ